MKYFLTVRSRPRADDPVPGKHERVRAHFSRMSPPWDLGAKGWPDAPEPGTQPLTIVNLSKCLEKGVKGKLNYSNRKYLPDEAQADDWLRLEFDPAKVDYQTLVPSAIREYIRALGAYLATVYDREFDVKDANRWQRSGIDPRQGVFRFYPVHFLDRELCRRAFGMSPEEVARRLEGEVERVSTENDGVLVIASSKPLDFAAANKVDKQVRSALAK